LEQTRRVTDRWTFVVLASGLLAACGDSNDASTVDVPVSFLTFNTALVAHTGNLDERLAAIARDLPKTNADVVCLQELWQPSMVDTLVSLVKKDYPYAHWSVAEGGPAVGCSADETGVLSGCFIENCAEAADGDRVTCVVANCADEFTEVSTECQNCVLNNQTLPPADIASTCELLDENAVAYDNQNGLLLLSNYPLKSKDYRPFESSFGDRGVLSAQIETALLPSVDLFCTHLAATQTDIPYPGEYGSWEGERAAQVEELLDFVDTTQSAHASAVVMGDMNCGPKGDTVVGEDVDGFNLLLASELGAEYLKGELSCTFCAENTLAGTETASVLIDHVLFSGLPDNVQQRMDRVFDTPVTLEVDDKPVKTYRSDHFGLSVTVSPNRETRD
jgi:endonuclease/exonuclease/phosphatase family metal-dependent hydrolase